MQDSIPIDALFDSSGVNPNQSCDPRKALFEAQVILAVDVMTGDKALIYGAELMKAALTAQKPLMVPAMTISLDKNTDELELLLALVMTIKGSHDYGKARVFSN